jgi:hypothetical protein
MRPRRLAILAAAHLTLSGRDLGARLHFSLGSMPPPNPPKASNPMANPASTAGLRAVSRLGALPNPPNPLPACSARLGGLGAPPNPGSAWKAALAGRVRAPIRCFRWIRWGACIRAFSAPPKGRTGSRSPDQLPGITPRFAVHYRGGRPAPDPSVFLEDADDLASGCRVPTEPEVRRRVDQHPLLLLGLRINLGAAPAGGNAWTQIA